MKHLSILMLVLLVGCSVVQAPPPTVPESRRVEEKELPPDPRTEEIPGTHPSKEWVESQDKGVCVDEEGEIVPPPLKPCPAKSGILVSESRAARDALYRIRYEELRKTYESDRAVWTVQRELYEERLKLSNETIYKLQPSWWDRHKFEAGTGLGLVLGIGSIIGVSFILK